MNTYWIIFKDGTKGCCEGFNENHAKAIATKLKEKEVAEVQKLPYPASPAIWQFDDPVHGEIPHFCFQPDKCAGKSSCPRSPDCVN